MKALLLLLPPLLLTPPPPQDYEMRSAFGEATIQPAIVFGAKGIQSLCIGHVGNKRKAKVTVQGLVSAILSSLPAHRPCALAPRSRCPERDENDLRVEFRAACTGYKEFVVEMSSGSGRRYAAAAAGTDMPLPDDLLDDIARNAEAWRVLSDAEKEPYKEKASVKNREFEAQQEQKQQAAAAQVREHSSAVELCGLMLPSPLPCYGPLTAGRDGAAATRGGGDVSRQSRGAVLRCAPSEGLRCSLCHVSRPQPPTD